MWLSDIKLLASYSNVAENELANENTQTTRTGQSLTATFDAGEVVAPLGFSTWCYKQMTAYAMLIFNLYESDVVFTFSARYDWEVSFRCKTFGCPGQFTPMSGVQGCPSCFRRRFQ